MALKLKAEQIVLPPGESFRLLRWTKNLHDVEVMVADGHNQAVVGVGHEWHHHAQLELTLVTRGAGTRFVGDAIAPFRAPDLVLIGENLPHYWHMRQPSSGYAIQFAVDTRHPFWQLPETESLRGLCREARLGLRVTGRPVAEIAGLIESVAACHGLRRLARLLDILAILASSPSGNRTPLSSAAFVLPERPTTYRGLQQAVNLIFNRFHEEIALADLLRATGMSKATFSRHFKHHTGRTFTRFLAEVRLHFASRQLIETDLPVAEIAFASGFNNLSHFNHSFMALHRQPPRAFRETARRAAESRTPKK